MESLIELNNVSGPLVVKERDIHWKLLWVKTDVLPLDTVHPPHQTEVPAPDPIAAGESARSQPYTASSSNAFTSSPEAIIHAMGKVLVEAMKPNMKSSPYDSGTLIDWFPSDLERMTSTPGWNRFIRCCLSGTALFRRREQLSLRALGPQLWE